VRSLPAYTPRSATAVPDKNGTKSKSRWPGDNPNPKSKSSPALNGSSYNNGADDTPKSFSRLLAFQQTGKRLLKGLDYGAAQQSSGGKKRKDGADPSPAAAAGPSEPTAPPTDPEIPQIKPGERLANFARRVDQALVLPAHSSKKTSLLPGGLKDDFAPPTTRHNRRLARVQAEWRAAEARRREKLAEAEEEAEDEREEHELLWRDVRGRKKKKKKKKPKKGGRQPDGDGGGDDDDSDDPWAVLARKRADTKQRNLQDVVQAPPQQLRQVKGGAKEAVAGVEVRDVPGRAGSLRRREEMGRVRREVLGEYRRRRMGLRRAEVC